MIHAPPVRHPAPPIGPGVTIVRHRRERRRKCSLSPLRSLPGFAFHIYGGPLVNVEGHVRLAREGPALTEADARCSLLLLDGTWRLVEVMEATYAHVPPRSLPRVRTAYPRVSKLFEDPEEGLASIEALAVAFALLGRDPRPLLATYRWREGFLSGNSALFDRWSTHSEERGLPRDPQSAI